MTKLFGNIKKKKFALTSNDSKFLKVHFFHHKKNFKRNLVINTFVGNSIMNAISGSNCILPKKKKKKKKKNMIKVCVFQHSSSLWNQRTVKWRRSILPFCWGEYMEQWIWICPFLLSNIIFCFFGSPHYICICIIGTDTNILYYYFLL